MGNYQSLDVNYWCSWSEEMPAETTDEQKMARIQEVLDVCRKEVERRIDEDILDVTERKVFANISKK